MLKTSVALIAAALTVCACSGSSSVLGPSAANVAVQPGDLPSGMVKCDLTGDIDSFIKAEQSPDPATSKTLADTWKDAKSKGATAGYTAVWQNKSFVVSLAVLNLDAAAAKNVATSENGRIK